MISQTFDINKQEIFNKILFIPQHHTYVRFSDELLEKLQFLLLLVSQAY